MEKQIQILHLEDDAGKLEHSRDSTLCDYNRAGTPLLEIVSEPELYSTRSASAYAREMRKILRYIGSSDCDMEKGMMRFDINISIRKKGEKKFGTKVEVKNLNSFKFLEKALDYENLVIAAQQMIRKGQFFWDMISAENSVGFHNPAKALDTLASSQQFSQKAVDLACEATKFGISKDLAKDIKQIVPPILKHSRKLQQDPEHMKTHEWFKYIPVLPAANQVWDGQKKL